ncbi:zinc finger protein 93-like [Leptidea sinapis]|uniref:zinc finger protein 93-like n=1 Tax=Leptidea sinapis TaxID=189913 RepID=UPI0021C3FC97|nr:zinc finger protein 93-like [Leptidea sinapis]
MDGDASPITEESCPVLLIPRKCTAFEINCEPMENLYLDLNITSIDAEGNVASIYDGCCNVRFLDHYDINYVSNDEPMLEDQLVGQPNDEIDQMRAIIPQESHYADDELECGLFLTKLPDEILNKNDGESVEQRTYQDTTERSQALKQLLSTDLIPKQLKTIMYLGEDSQSGQTIQTIDDPRLKCSYYSYEDENGRNNSVSGQKQYQCVKCEQLFDNIHLFKQHTSKSHSLSTTVPPRDHHCPICKQTLKTKLTYDLHRSRHGNPGLECRKCYKVFASNQSLRNHKKYSLISDQSDEEMRFDVVKEADSVIQQVMSNEVFLLPNRKNFKNHSKKVVCDVCNKPFYRISDLKRHLIEHVTRSTLAKIPVNNSGGLSILCEVCHTETFTKIDRYKAHLREHAHLTLYKCQFCDRSFGDSSNFSKHKKIHVASIFQCDMCNKKFNTKKKIIEHIGRHNQASPIFCPQCNKTFHFTSQLNKHLQTVHRRTKRYKCPFCHEFFGSLKFKWDHEWLIHKVRKTPFDCWNCHFKCRKYTDLKRHCRDNHSIDIPSIKDFIGRKFNGRI